MADIDRSNPSPIESLRRNLRKQLSKKDRQNLDDKSNAAQHSVVSQTCGYLGNGKCCKD